MPLRRRYLVACAVSLAIVAGGSPAHAAGGFGDVPYDAYYAEAVQWMADSEIATGTEHECFAPTTVATRGQVAVFIHRSAGEPPGGSEPFDDVGPDAYYREAVAWMVGAGIANGTSTRTFEPDRSITRGEIAAVLHRWHGSPAAPAAPFSDVDPGAFYASAVGWLLEQGITTGMSPTEFGPDLPVTRAQIAAFLHRVFGSPGVTLTVGADCASAPLDVQLDVAEAYSHVLLNELRASLGRAPLPRNPSMDADARDWSETMDRTGDFKHSNLPYGENIAWWSAGFMAPEVAAQRLHDLWVDSPGHYANMTNGSYRQTGVGFWRSANGWHATHVFTRAAP